MRKLKRFLVIGCTAMMVVSAAGCSSTTTSSDATETTQDKTTADTTTTDSASTSSASDSTNGTATTTDNAAATTTQAADGSVVFGKVTAVDGTSVTLALGDMPQGKDMGSKTAPDATTDSATSSTDTTTKAAPSGDASGTGNQPPSGEAPSGDAKGTDGQAPSGDAPTGEAPDMSAMFEESGETLTITVDESLIKIMSGSETTTGTLSDITVDSILSIAYDDSNNITSITIQSATK